MDADPQYFVLDRWTAASGRPFNRQFARSGHFEIRRPVDIAERVAADDYRLGPAGHEAGDVAADDRLPENGTVKYVADGVIGRLPRLLQIEFLHPCRVGSDGGALDADAVDPDRVRRFDTYGIVGFVAVLEAQVEVLQLDIEIEEGSAFP